VLLLSFPVARTAFPAILTSIIMPNKRENSPLYRLPMQIAKIPLSRTFYGLSLPQTHSCSEGLESNCRSRYNSSSNRNDKHLFLHQFFSLADSEDTSNKNPETRNLSQHQVDNQSEFKKNNKDSAFLTKMWWADVKAAFGQRINFEGILCSTMVILKDPHLALPHISVPDIRYIDWAALRRKGFKGVVFDKDNTLTVPYSLTPWPPLESSLECCKSEFGQDIAVFSNSAGNSNMKNFKIVLKLWQ
jgi:phosphatidylglycerophosphatase GEP4